MTDVATRFQDADPPRLRDAYSLAKDVVYLNHASIGTVPRVVHEAQVRYLALCETNPWLHVWGGAWEEPRADVRRKLADELGCEPAELALNHNTTEGFNLLAQGLPLGPKDEVLFPTHNHPGASVAWDHFGERRGFSVRRFAVPMTEFGSWSSSDIVARLKAAIRPGKTRVLVLPHVDNILGVRHPVAAITKVARKAGVEWIAVDGAQTVGQIPLDFHALGIDFYCASPHKWLQAPKGTGLLFARKEVQEKLDPMWVTWGQRNWRGSARGYEDYGTRDLAAVLTLGHAVDFQRRLAGPNGERRSARLEGLREHAHEVVAAHPELKWMSPRRFVDGASIYAVGVETTDVRRTARDLFERHGIVVRPFDLDGRKMLRVAPNMETAKAEIESFSIQVVEGV